MRAALTFDVEDPDSPNHVGASELATILGALDEAGMRATFFVQGRWLEAHPEAAAAIGAGGHLVGNHSYFHVDSRFLSAEGLRQDVTRAHRAIEGAVGADDRPWYRLPYGAGAESPVIAARLRALGYRHVGWDVDPRDYALTDPAELVPAVAAGLEARRRVGAGHAIVLLHSWPVATAAGMPELCRYLAGNCEATVTVDQVPGQGAVPTRSPLAHALRWAGSRAKHALPGGRGAVRA